MVDCRFGGAGYFVLKFCGIVGGRLGKCHQCLTAIFLVGDCRRRFFSRISVIIPDGIGFYCGNWLGNRPGRVIASLPIPLAQVLSGIRYVVRRYVTGLGVKF